MVVVAVFSLPHPAGAGSPLRMPSWYPSRSRQQNLRLGGVSNNSSDSSPAERRYSGLLQASGQDSQNLGLRERIPSRSDGWP